MRNLLIVTTVAADGDRLAEELGEAVAGEPVNVRVVAPAAQLSRLDWLTNDEDQARNEAAEAADRVAGAVGDGNTVDVDRGSQDSDAAQAVADALRNFPADEIIIVTRPGSDASWLEDETLASAFAKLDVPVRRVELPEA